MSHPSECILENDAKPEKWKNTILNFALKCESNSRVCSLFVRPNNINGKDGIIIPIGMYCYWNVALHLLGIGTAFLKLSKELYVPFFSRKPWIVPTAIAWKLKASSITNLQKMSKCLAKVFRKTIFFIYCEIIYKLRKIIYMIVCCHCSERFGKSLWFFLQSL